MFSVSLSLQCLCRLVSFISSSMTACLYSLDLTKLLYLCVWRVHYISLLWIWGALIWDINPVHVTFMFTLFSKSGWHWHRWNRKIMFYSFASGETFRNLADIFCGVPQGSILGPISFNLYAIYALYHTTVSYYCYGDVLCLI